MKLIMVTRKKIMVIFTSLFCLSMLSHVNANIPLVNFTESLNIRAREMPFPQRMRQVIYEFITQPEPYTLFGDFLQKLYEQNQAKNNGREITTNKIPQTIHQIWLGKTLPEAFRRFQQTWIAKHPTWKYILWTDQQALHNPDLAKNSNYQERHVDSFGQFRNEQLINQTQNLAEKSDLYRLEILFRYGGLYVDCDAECFKPFDALHATYDFYAGIEPMECGRLVGNAIIGAKPGHPIINYCIETVTSSKEFAALNMRFFRGCDIVCATGPVVLSRAVMKYANHDANCDIVLPTSYFYPCGLCAPHPAPKPESLAAHYWTLTWGPKK